MVVLGVASPGKVVMGAVLLVVGVATLVFNSRWTAAAIAAQREGIGSLLGTRRRVSDDLHRSRPFVLGARVFAGLMSVFFCVVGAALIITGL